MYELRYVGVVGWGVVDGEGERILMVVELGVAGTGWVLDDDAVEAEDEPVRDGTRLSTEEE